MIFQKFFGGSAPDPPTCWGEATAPPIDPTLSAPRRLIALLNRPSMSRNGEIKSWQP